MWFELSAFILVFLGCYYQVGLATAILLLAIAAASYGVPFATSAYAAGALVLSARVIIETMPRSVPRSTDLPTATRTGSGWGKKAAPFVVSALALTLFGLKHSEIRPAVPIVILAVVLPYFMRTTAPKRATLAPGSRP